MNKNLKMYFLYLMSIACLISCSESGTSNTVVQQYAEKNTLQKVESIHLGNGSGDLTIDGRDERLTDKSLILIKGVLIIMFLLEILKVIWISLSSLKMWDKFLSEMK